MAIVSYLHINIQHDKLKLKRTPRRATLRQGTVLCLQSDISVLCITVPYAARTANLTSQKINHIYVQNDTFIQIFQQQKI